MRILFRVIILVLVLPCALRAAEPSASPADGPTAAVAGTGQEGHGLTIFLVDRFAEELRGTGWEERKQILLAYQAPSAVVAPGSEVSERQNMDAARAKMVFHMLKILAGAERFEAAQKEFITLAKLRDVSWDDVKTVFERQTERDLEWFFAQWLRGQALPDLRVEGAAARRSGAKFEVSFDLVQNGTVFTLDVPLTVTLVGGGMKKETVRIDAKKKSVTLLVDGEPLDLVVDGDYDLARMLTIAETPPSIRTLLGGAKPIAVKPVIRSEVYKPVIDGLKQLGAEERDAVDLTEKEIRSSSLFILGANNPTGARLYGAVRMPEEGFSVVVKRNPWNEGKGVGIVQAISAEEATAAWAGIRNAGAYGIVAFSKGTIVSRRIADSERGIRMELGQETMAVDLSAIKTLDDVIEGAVGKKIVYVGEYHDRFAHHNVELRVIERLYRKDARIAVGMEMFQRPFQSVLDDFIAGTIDEREFLRRSEYFSRWGFDYNLYKPILDFCRAEKIPVVALNIRREITEKVSKSGLDSLTEEERKELPAQTDFSDDEYRRRLKDVFDEHRNSSERQFVFFYQAQILWDETMAETVDEFFRKRPDHRIVVIAGSGHLAHRSGIPKRVFRRNGQEYALIVNDAEVEREIADYIVFPPDMEGITAPKLMVLLKEADGRVAITGFSKESPAEKAGLETGDIILALDGEPVKDVGDVKLALYFKKSGETLAVKARRSRILLGDKDIVVNVKL